MSRNTAAAFGQPSLDTLMMQFLASGSDAAAAAVGPSEGEVEPHEVAAGFRPDAKAAWADATAGVAAAAPPEWAAVAALPGSVPALAFAAGNFPQRVRDLHPLLSAFDPAALRPKADAAPLPGFATLRAWVTKAAAPLLAAGVARVLGDFDAANKLLDAADAGPSRENERAALLWHRGRCAAALTAWEALPDAPAVLFNRGMARLFLGRYADARQSLTAAVAAIPEANAWHDLARLYLAVAEMQG